MDGYPLGSLDHNVPLIVASGLTSQAAAIELDDALRDEGALIRSELPALDSQEAEWLEKYFADVDSRGKSWKTVGRHEGYRLRIKSVDRTFQLPARKARIPPEIDSSDANPILHSPFSPLSPASSLYPDGLMSTDWIKKHQEMLPAIIVCFYSLNMDPTTATLDDNKLKVDINNIKSILTNGGFKTRLALVFLQKQGDGNTPTISEKVQERLESIRKGTAMDPKSMFYVAPQETPDDLRSVADSILTNLYGTAIEYYRDLGRHSRKKRSRGVAPKPTIPPTSGTSQTLSLPDWNFRYDFKTALLSEFRQELDPALRTFDQAYEILLGQDVLEFIPSWSPRWNEARLLADIICIRCLRLHLRMGQPSLAVRRWQAHRDRVGDFVDRRGNGTNNYGWQAWEARWALVMANLIEKMELPAFAPATTNLFLPPERAVMGERLQPWELLHHTGYWYRIAARHLRARRTLAKMIPDEDRSKPETTAAKAASQTHYDTYLCPPPHLEYPLDGEGVNHSQLITDCLIAARTQFQGRSQLRIACELALECAREMAATEAWTEVLALLRPIWEDLSFRSEGWVDVSEELCWLMRRAAAASGRGDLLVAIDWELLDKKFTRRPHWHYDLSKSLDGVPASEKPKISISDETGAAFFSTSFVFAKRESKAGQTCKAQLSIVSNAMQGSAPIIISKLRIDFEGSLRPILIEHDGQAISTPSTKTIFIASLKLEEDLEEKSEDELSSELRGHADLTLKAGERRVFEIDVPLRAAGDVQALSVRYWYETKAFDLDYNMKFRETDTAPGWYVAGASKPRKMRADSRSLHVQPRPPKMDIVLGKPMDQFYVNELIRLDVELENNESETANVKVTVYLNGKQISPFRVKANDEEQTSQITAEGESQVTGVALGKIDSSSSLGFQVEIDPASAPMLYEVHIEATYHLESDNATPIIQTLPLQFNLVNAFEANYDLVPRLHADPWPSLFDFEGLDHVPEDGTPVLPRGLIQKWCLMCHFASFAQTDLKVLDTKLEVTSTVGGAQSQITRTTDLPADGLRVAPKTMHEAQFDLVVQKTALEDRNPVSLELAFVIHWKRDDAAADETASVTAMPVGKYLVLGAEPRVLASTLHAPSDKMNMMQLDLTIENPSHHLLTFGLSMEPSDEFAFSGAKQTTVHLVPMSRRVVTYRLLPLSKGSYIRPGLAVRDKYFQKVLRIIPTEGMKIDKDGLLIWVPGHGPGSGGGDDDDDDDDDGSKSEE